MVAGGPEGPTAARCAERGGVGDSDLLRAEGGGALECDGLECAVETPSCRCR
jgi:hypothetical protein